MECQKSTNKDKQKFSGITKSLSNKQFGPFSTYIKQIKTVVESTAYLQFTQYTRQCLVMDFVLE